MEGVLVRVMALVYRVKQPNRHMEEEDGKEYTGGGTQEGELH